MPDTRKPKSPVPRNYVPPNTEPYKVQDGDTLVSLAASRGMTWKQLALLNWRTSVPEEVNWYLARNVGCTESSPDGHNYSFTSADDPGLIYLPLAGLPRGGGQPGVSGPPPPPPEPKKSAAKRAGAARVARNSVNILKLPVVRLPVGWKVAMRRRFTRFRLWVPTNTGGTLTIRHHGTGTVDLRQPAKNVLEPAAKEIVHELKAGEFGEFFVLADGKPDDYIECTFVQISFSRDGTGDTDTPLVPWNFYFWPTALKVQLADGSVKDNPWPDKAADVMRRYGQAFGLDADACRQAEKTDHGSPALGAGWEGHCHNAAPASMLFDVPTQATYKGVSFADEEMKLLATEYCGNFGAFGEFWELNRGSTKPGGPQARWYLPGYFKPGGEKTRDGFVWGLKQEGYTAASGPDSAEVIADVHVAASGGEAAFTRKIEKWLGELAAEFYDALIRLMRVKKHPLLSNMRSYSGGAGPEQVWNQVFFWYQAWYQENGDTKDERDMIIVSDLRANRDTYPCMSLPAEVNGSDMKPKDADSLIFRHEWRIQFDDAGKILLADPKNEWRHAQNTMREELYAPTNLLTMVKPLTSRRSGTPFGLGNKYVGTELVAKGLLTLHKRYT